MQLQKSLRLSKAVIEKVEITPVDEAQPTAVLVISAPLTKSNAEILGQDFLFAGDVARGGRHTPDDGQKTIEGVRVELPTDGKGEPLVLNPIRIGSLSYANDDGEGLRVTMRIKLNPAKNANSHEGEVLAAVAYAVEQNRAALAIVIRPDQRNLFDGPEAEAEDEAPPLKGEAAQAHAGEEDAARQRLITGRKGGKLQPVAVTKDAAKERTDADRPN